MQQQDSGNPIPRVVVIVGDEGIDGIAVLSTVPVNFVLVSEQENELFASQSAAADGDLDADYALGKDEDGNAVVIVGPYGPDALDNDERIDHFWRQSPHYLAPWDKTSSEPVSEPVSEAISGTISGTESGQESSPEIWQDNWCKRCGHEVTPSNVTGKRLFYDIEAISERHLCADCVLDLFRTDPTCEGVMNYVERREQA